MSTRIQVPKSVSSDSRVSLWIDAVGGYRLLRGSWFTIGGVGGSTRPDIAVRCAWGSQHATIERVEDDFWLMLGASGALPGASEAGRPTLIRYGSPLNLQPTGEDSSSSPKLTFHKPSLLSRTVVVGLQPPHRFADPVDSVILMDSTLLIGPSQEHHVRVPRLANQYVLTLAGERIGLRGAGQTHTLQLGVPLDLDELTITLRNDG